MSKSPAFQFYPNDWLSSPQIMLMTPAQEGAYIRLLAIAWMNDDCGLPSDIDQLAALSRIDRVAIALVMQCFKKVGERYYNERLLEERKKQELWSKKSSAAGRKGAKTRWGSPKKDHRVGYNLVMRNAIPNNDSSSSSSSSINKEINKEKFLDFVYLLPDETKKLKERFGTDFDNWIERLNTYLGKIGPRAAKKYASHYFTILSWDRKDGSTKPTQEVKRVKTDEEINAEFNSI